MSTRSACLEPANLSPRRAAAAWRGVLFAGAKVLRIAERDLVEHLRVIGASSAAG